MKKLISILASVSLLSSSAMVASSADKGACQPDVYVDGSIVQFADQNAYITDEGRTLVPARGVFEAMDCNVSWDAENYVVTVANVELKKEIFLAINDTAMKVVTDGKEETKTLDVAATLMNNRTMIPLRAVSEALGCDVGWNSDEYRVDISSVKVEKEKAPLDAKIYLKAPTDTIRVGDTISVPVMVSNAKGLKGAMFKVKWDPKMLKMLELDPKNNKAFGGYTDAPALFGEICDVNSSTVSAGTITVAGSASKVIETDSKDYSLGVLRFTVLSGAANKNVVLEFEITDMATNGNDGESNVAFSACEGTTFAVKEKASSGGGGGGGGSGRPSRPSSGGGSGSGSGSGSSSDSGSDNGSDSGSEDSGNTETPDNPQNPDDGNDEPDPVEANVIYTFGTVSAAPGETVDVEVSVEFLEEANIISIGLISVEGAEIVGFTFAEDISELINFSLTNYDPDLQAVNVLFKDEAGMFSGTLGTVQIRIPGNASGELVVTAKAPYAVNKANKATTTAVVNGKIEL